MKKHILIALILALAFISSVLANSTDSVRVGITLQSAKNARFDDMAFGIHSWATTGLDKGLGEFNIPMFPPSGVHGVFLIDGVNKDGEKETYWSYLDFVPPPKTNEDSVVYKIQVANVVDTLIVRWPTLPKNIIKAYFRDDYNDPGGYLVNASMKDSSQVVILNDNLTKYKIVVWYDVTTGINENSGVTDSQIDVYPNPFTDRIYVTGLTQGGSIKIISALGDEITSSRINEQSAQIELKDIAPGMYFVVLVKPDGSVITKKVMKINQ